MRPRQPRPPLPDCRKTGSGRRIHHDQRRDGPTLDPSNKSALAGIILALESEVEAFIAEILGLGVNTHPNLIR